MPPLGMAADIARGDMDEPEDIRLLKSGRLECERGEFLVAARNSAAP